MATVATLNPCAQYAVAVVVNVVVGVDVAAVATISAITPTDVMTMITIPAAIISVSSATTMIAEMLAHRMLAVAAEVVLVAAEAAATITAVAMTDVVSIVGRHVTSRTAGTINTTITPRRCGRRVK